MKGICPICGTKGRVTGRHCKFSPSQHIYLCGNSSGLPVLGFTYLGQSSGGTGGFFQVYKDSKYFKPGDSEWMQLNRESFDFQEYLKGEDTEPTPDNSAALKNAIGWLIAQFTHGHTNAAIAELSHRKIPTELWGEFKSAGARFTLTVPPEHQPHLPKIKGDLWKYRGAYQNEQDQWIEIRDRILIPIRALDGQWIGAQFHNLDGPNKYTWMSAANGPEYKVNGEPPLQFINRTQKGWESANVIGICEGVGYKAHVLAHRLGIPVVGAVGGNWVGSPTQWGQLLELNPNATYVLYADAGWKIQPDLSVCDRMAKLAVLFKENWPKTKLQLAEWGQSSGVKGDTQVGDCDEVAIERLQGATFLKASAILDFLNEKLKSNAQLVINLTEKTAFEFTQVFDSLILTGDAESAISQIKAEIASTNPELDSRNLNDIAVRKISDRLDTIIDDFWKNNKFKELASFEGELFLKRIKSRTTQWQILQVLIGLKDIKFNQVTQKIEINGEPYDDDFNKYTFMLRYGFEFDKKMSKEEFFDVVKTTAEINTYNPIQDYLNHCYTRYWDSKILDGLADQLFGAATPIHQTYLTKFLIGCVARAMKPGCKLDTMYILAGPQGYKKSSFFEILASTQWFDGSFTNHEDRDGLLKLHSSWIIEWAELSNMNRKEIEGVKQMLSTHVDNIRRPYGRISKKLERPSVLVGTTNGDSLLKDDTGSRRFWITPVSKRIDESWLIEHRDEIWGAAMRLYTQGLNSDAHWWLTQEEEASANVAREPFNDEDAWLEDIQAIVLNSTFTTVTHIHDRLNIPMAQRNAISKKRIISCLKALGFELTNTKRNPLISGTSRTHIATPAFKEYLQTCGMDVVKGWGRKSKPISQEEATALLEQLNGHIQGAEFTPIDYQADLKDPDPDVN